MMDVFLISGGRQETHCKETRIQHQFIFNSVNIIFCFELVCLSFSSAAFVRQ